MFGKLDTCGMISVYGDRFFFGIYAAAHAGTVGLMFFLGGVVHQAGDWHPPTASYTAFVIDVGPHPFAVICAQDRIVCRG